MRTCADIYIPLLNQPENKISKIRYLNKAGETRGRRGKERKKERESDR